MVMIEFIRLTMRTAGARPLIGFETRRMATRSRSKVDPVKIEKIKSRWNSLAAEHLKKQQKLVC
jgi:hypothetical protein